MTYRISYEGPTSFVATDRGPHEARLIVECPDGLVAGSDVRVSISTFHTLDLGRSDLTGLEVEGGEGIVVLGHGVPRSSWTEATQGGVGPAGGGLIGRPVGAVYLSTVQVRKSLSPGARIVFSYDLVVVAHSGLGGELFVSVREPLSDNFSRVGESIPLSIEPGEPTRVEVRVSPTPDEKGKTRATVFLTDDVLNPVSDCHAEISLTGSGIEGLPASVRIGGSEAMSVAGLRIVGPGPVRLEARADNGLEATSPPALGEAMGESRHFFGAIHFHTRLSVDGDRDPRAAFAYARDVLNLDVIALGDHAPPGPYWDEAMEVNEAFDEPGRFVTLPGWESSTTYGHANVYLRSADVDGGPWHWDPDRCPSEIAWDPGVVVVPHHTNQGTPMPSGKSRELLSRGQYWGSYDWTVPNERVRLVEMVQCRGCYEADLPDEYWDIVSFGSRASVRDALRMGWRLGFVAGTDNHAGYPTQDNPPLSGTYAGLSCFRAPELTRDAIWQAMDQRRTYATSGVPIVADFSVNDIRSGGEGILTGREVSFAATLHGTAPIERVEIISEHDTVWESEPGSLDVELEGSLPAPEGAWAYYYLRLRQTDGHRAWLSPVWLDA